MPDLIGEIMKADKMIKGELCPWCGADLKLWLLEAREEHAKDAVCNSKEAECLALIEDLAWNFDRGDCGQPDTPDPRKVLNLLARIIKEG